MPLFGTAVGRWQKGKDLSWYSKAEDPTSLDDAQKARQEEIQRIKEAERAALGQALGYEIDPEGPLGSGANATPVSGGERVRRIDDGARAGAEESGEREGERRRRKRHGSRERDGERERHRRHREGRDGRTRSRSRTRDSPRRRGSDAAQGRRGERPWSRERRGGRYSRERSKERPRPTDHFNNNRDGSRPDDRHAIMPSQGRRSPSRSRSRDRDYMRKRRRRSRSDSLDARQSWREHRHHERSGYRRRSRSPER
jgi:hypothetical protein